ncbi:MAG: DUF4160 domain-containing protein [Acidobacteriota bacterium]|jgi:hypothetical protein|nr:DUF4160 domain-containing protein [Acidobacteriota bacterium]
MIYTRDHTPAHVHVFKQGEVIINLGDADTPVFVRENNGMSRKDERDALFLVAEYQEFLLEKWREIYG